MNVLKEYAKAIAAFIFGVVGNAIVQLIKGEVPWPQTGAEWAQFALTSFGAAIGALVATNKITQKQLDKDPHVVGGTVVDVPPAQSASPWQNPWKG